MIHLPVDTFVFHFYDVLIAIFYPAPYQQVASCEDPVCILVSCWNRFNLNLSHFGEVLDITMENKYVDNILLLRVIRVEWQNKINYGITNDSGAG
jgi:hypothetical protein